MTDKSDRFQAGVAHLEAMFTTGDAEPVEIAATSAEPAQDASAGRSTGIAAPAATAAELPPATGLEAIARAEARSRELYEQQKRDLEAKRAEVDKHLEQVTQFDQMRQRLREDPLNTVRALLGKETSDDDIVSMFYGSLPTATGAASDNVGKLQAKLDRMEQENQKYRQEIDQRIRAKEQSEFQERYRNELATFMRSAESSDLDLVRDYFEASPDIAMADLFSAAGRLAARNPDGPLVKPHEVAKAVNEQLSSLLQPLLDKRLKKLTEGKPSAATQRPLADNRTLMNQSSTPTTPSKRTGLSSKERYANAVAWAKSNMKLE